jgi:Optic atrophy 3 protein (OPA3)
MFGKPGRSPQTKTNVDDAPRRNPEGVGLEMATVKLATLVIRVSHILFTSYFAESHGFRTRVCGDVSQALQHSDKEPGTAVSFSPTQWQLGREVNRTDVPYRHERFREFCVSLAQRIYRTEVKLRTNILGEPAKHVRPLSETKYDSSAACGRTLLLIRLFPQGNRERCQCPCGGLFVHRGSCADNR